MRNARASAAIRAGIEQGDSLDLQAACLAIQLDMIVNLRLHIYDASHRLPSAVGRGAAHLRANAPLRSAQSSLSGAKSLVRGF